MHVNAKSALLDIRAEIELKKGIYILKFYK